MSASNSNPPREISRMPFDPTQERAIDGMSRWMGTLGRFQVLSGGLLMLLVVGVGIAYSTTSDSASPVVRLGEIDPRALGVAGSAAFVLGFLLLRGGIFLTDSAEEFERIISGNDQDGKSLEQALRHLRSYALVELLFTLICLTAASVWALPSWQ